MGRDRRMIHKADYLRLFGARLKYLRERRGVNLERTASSLGKTPEWLADVEDGGGAPTPVDLERLAKALAEDAGYLGRLLRELERSPRGAAARRLSKWHGVSLDTTPRDSSDDTTAVAADFRQRILGRYSDRELRLAS